MSSSDSQRARNVNESFLCLYWQPPIVFADEWPILLRHSRVDWIAANVADDSIKISARIQKNLPPRPAPDWMRKCPPVRLDQRVAAVLLHFLDHRLRMIPMLADQHMDVFRHDGAGVASVALFLDDVRERVSNQIDLLVVEQHHLMSQNILGVLLKLVEL